MSKYLAILLFSLPCLSMAAQPIFYAPLDDSAEVIAPDGSKLKSGIIYGKSGYFQGVSGKALEVKRHAYDQATALNFAGLPEKDWNEATVSFWFLNLKKMEERKRKLSSFQASKFAKKLQN